MTDLLSTLPVCGLCAVGAVVIAAVSLAVTRICEWAWKRSARLEKEVTK